MRGRKGPRAWEEETHVGEEVGGGPSPIGRRGDVKGGKNLRHPADHLGGGVGVPGIPQDPHTVPSGGLNLSGVSLRLGSFNTKCVRSQPRCALTQSLLTHPCYPWVRHPQISEFTTPPSSPHPPVPAPEAAAYSLPHHKPRVSVYEVSRCQPGVPPQPLARQPAAGSPGTSGGAG